MRYAAAATFTCCYSHSLASADTGSTRADGPDGKRTRADGTDGHRDRGAVARDALRVLTPTRRPGARAPAASSMILIMIESVMCDIILECDL